jgi:hypothetical protein
VPAANGSPYGDVELTIHKIHPQSPPADWRSLKLDQIGLLTNDQVSWLGRDDLAALSPAQVAQFTQRR